MDFAAKKPGARKGDYCGESRATKCTRIFIFSVHRRPFLLQDNVVNYWGPGGVRRLKVPPGHVRAPRSPEQLGSGGHPSSTTAELSCVIQPCNFSAVISPEPGTFFVEPAGIT